MLGDTDVARSVAREMCANVSRKTLLPIVTAITSFYDMFIWLTSYAATTLPNPVESAHPSNFRLIANP
jgi:hypothetical protein